MSELQEKYQALLDLACTPAILITNRQHLSLQSGPAAPRRMLWSARAIGQPGRPLLLIPPSPFVTSFPADAEPPAQLTEIVSWLLRQAQKLVSQTHGRTLLPRHAPLLKRSSCHCLLCYPCLRTPVTHVSGMYIGRGLGEGLGIKVGSSSPPFCERLGPFIDNSAKPSSPALLPRGEGRPR